MNNDAELKTNPAQGATLDVAPPPVDMPLAAEDGINPVGIRTAGIRMIPVVGGKYKVWTKRFGPATGEADIKILLLHGGPGFGHPYLEAFESFLPQAGIEMYYYDQLGTYNSDKPNDLSLWTLARYTEEVEEVRRGLGLDNFFLLGHSWGGILAIEYALHYQQHLRGLIISNMTASAADYLRCTARLKVELLSAESLAKLNALEAAEDYDHPEYQRIMMEELYPFVICRIQPWPEPVERAFRSVNTTIYGHMQGKSEFLVTGNLKDWDRWERLHEIKVRTLTLGGAYDEMDPEDLTKMAALMPNGSNATCPNGSHLCMWDDQANYFEYLIEFLRGA
jgi:proline iminopeptidase